MTYYISVLIIISNNILLNLPIVFIYYFILNGSFSDMLNLISLLLKIGFSILYY